jgi:hypothetical protein
MKSAPKQIASVAFLLFCAGTQVLAQDIKQTFYSMKITRGIR